MKTFDLNRPIHGVGDLSDGVLIAMCLKNMLVYTFFVFSLVNSLFVVMQIILMKLGYKKFELMLVITIE